MVSGHEMFRDSWLVFQVQRCLYRRCVWGLQKWIYCDHIWGVPLAWSLHRDRYADDDEESKKHPGSLFETTFARERVLTPSSLKLGPRPPAGEQEAFRALVTSRSEGVRTRSSSLIKGTARPSALVGGVDG